MKTSLFSNAIAGLIGLASLVNAQMQPFCNHPSSQDWVVGVTEWADIVDVPGFCGELRKNREASSNCQSTGTPICEVSNNSFEWSFTTVGDSCSNDDVHAIWTASGGNELVGFIYC